LGPENWRHQVGLQAAQSPRAGWSFYYAESPALSSDIWKVAVSGGDEISITSGVYRYSFGVAPNGIYFVSAPQFRVGSSVRFLNFANGRLRMCFPCPIQPIWVWGCRPTTGICTSRRSTIATATSCSLRTFNKMSRFEMRGCKRTLVRFALTALSVYLMYCRILVQARAEFEDVLVGSVLFPAFFSGHRTASRLREH
jgi:hypothetical protein